jgi:hypothetical protein
MEVHMNVDPSGTPERPARSSFTMLLRIVLVFLALPAATMLAVRWLLEGRPVQ